MNTITMHIGDVRDVMAELPDGHADLLVTSPPFLALRSYLPADHPDKHREIGSEPTPAAFVDTLLGLSADWRRLVPEWGSICVELGDTSSGSGGAGGDYSFDGWRDGQPKFGGSSSRGRTRDPNWSHSDALWLAGVIDTEGAIMVHRRHVDEPGSTSYLSAVRVTMMERQVCDRAAEITGVGSVTQDGRGAYSWGATGQQARYVLCNIWPHLLIKQRQALAAIELQRHLAEKRTERGYHEAVAPEHTRYREMIREFVSGLNARGEDRGKFESDWVPPTPLRINHPLVPTVGWPDAKSMCLIPHLYTIGLAYGHNPLTGTPSPAGRWRVRNVVAWARPNPPVGSLGKRNVVKRTGDQKFRPATSYITIACTGTGRFFDLDAVRTENPRVSEDPGGYRMVGGMPTHDAGPRSQNPAGAPPLDWHTDDLDGDWLWKLATAPYSGSHYACFPVTLPRRLILAMAPERVCTVCGWPSERIVSQTNEQYADVRRQIDATFQRSAPGANAGHTKSNPAGSLRSNGVVKPEYTTLGWTDCGHNAWRPGRVLDPFGGSGTTAVAAALEGRDAVLIDIDTRNIDLVHRRLSETVRIVDRVDHPDRVEWTVTPAATSELTAIANGQPSLFDTSGDAA